MCETTKAVSFRGFVVLCGLFFVNSVCQKTAKWKNWICSRKYPLKAMVVWADFYRAIGRSILLDSGFQS